MKIEEFEEKEEFLIPIRIEFDSTEYMLEKKIKSRWSETGFRDFKK